MSGAKLAISHEGLAFNAKLYDLPYCPKALRLRHCRQRIAMAWSIGLQAPGRRQQNGSQCGEDKDDTAYKKEIALVQWSLACSAKS